MYCSNCGRKIDNDNKYCIGCGIQINNNDTNVKNVTKKNSSGLRTASIILGIFSIVSSITLIFSIFGFIYSLVGFIVGIIALKKGRNILGIILNIIGFIISIISFLLLLLIMFIFVNEYSLADLDIANLGVNNNDEMFGLIPLNPNDSNDVTSDFKNDDGDIIDDSFVKDSCETSENGYTCQYYNDNRKKISVSSGEEKIININLKNTYDSTIRYGIYYYMIMPDELPKYVEITKADESENELEGIIETGKTKKISMRITNNSKEDIVLRIGSLVGNENADLYELLDDGEVLIK